MPGESFHLFSCAPIKGPLRLQTKRHDDIIGYELAASIWVELSRRGKGNKPPRA